jgi:hypothetical protein
VDLFFGPLFRIVRQLVVIFVKLPGPRGVFFGAGETHCGLGQVGAMESFIPSAATMGDTVSKVGFEFV